MHFQVVVGYWYFFLWEVFTEIVSPSLKWISSYCCWRSVCQASSRQAFSPLCRPSSKEDVIPTSSLAHIFYVLQFYPENRLSVPMFWSVPLQLFLVVSECQNFDTLWVIYFFFLQCWGFNWASHVHQASPLPLNHIASTIDWFSHGTRDCCDVSIFSSCVFLSFVGFLWFYSWASYLSPLPICVSVYSLWNAMMPGTVVFPALFFFYGFKSFL